jgi:hypothetical protein
MRLPFSERRGPCALACFFLFVCAAVAPCRAQSGDVNFPTPISSNIVTGTIVPRDVGDPRRTRHFYVFRGTEGDLSVRLVGTNLNGSVDVFAARTLRPLLTITLIPGTTTDATKTVYLREEELLVLRIEARAVGDNEGSYSITLGGSFAPAPAGLAEAPAPEVPQVSTEGRRGSGVRRVTSTGARVDEPPPAREEVRAETPAAPEGEAEGTTQPTAPPAPATPARRSNTRRNNRGAANTARNRARSPANTQPAEEAKPADAAEAATPEDAPAGRPAGEGSAAAAEPARPTRRNRGRNTRNTRRGANEGAAPSAGGAPSAEASSAAPVVAPQRLVIMTRGGETVEHDMNAVRRVTIENNQLVVTTKDGKTERRPMTTVLRVTIEPAPQP